MTESPHRRRPRWRAAAITVLTTAALGAAGVTIAQQASAATIDTSAYYILQNQNSGKVLDVYNMSTSDGAKLNQWSQNNGDWQQFKFLDMGSGWYRLQAKHSGKVINVSGASTANGAQVVQSNGDRNAYSQQWKIQDIGSNIQLINRNSGKALEIFQWSTADGGNVVQFDDLNAANQQWSLIKAGGSSGGGNGGGGTSPTAPWPSPIPARGHIFRPSSFAAPLERLPCGPARRSPRSLPDRKGARSARRNGDTSAPAGTGMAVGKARRAKPQAQRSGHATAFRAGCRNKDFPARRGCRRAAPRCRGVAERRGQGGHWAP